MRSTCYLIIRLCLCIQLLFKLMKRMETFSFLYVYSPYFNAYVITLLSVCLSSQFFPIFIRSMFYKTKVGN